MPPDLLQALLDPTAPVPQGWPTGAWGAFLLFMFPIGGGIPVGVLMARNGGVAPPLIAGLYFISDVLLACTTEPFLALLRWLSRRVPALGRLGDRLGALSERVGLRDSGARGPLGLILVSFSVSPTTGRAAAAAAGHGFIPGWTFAILGDMGYFALLMVSTLWLSDVLGNDRLVVGAMLAVTWVLPLLLRRLRGRAVQPATSGGAGGAPVPAVGPALVHAAAVARAPARQRRRGRKRS